MVRADVFVSPDVVYQCDVCGRMTGIIADLSDFTDKRRMRLCGSCVQHLALDIVRAEHERMLQEMKAKFEASRKGDDPCQHGDRM